MKCFIALGANLGDRKETFEKAARFLKQASHSEIIAAPLFINPALVPPGSPLEWRKDFYNSVIELEWPGTAFELLALLKKIETDLGRAASARWAPRIIDLDLILFGGEIIQTETLTVPHSLASERNFVLAPLKHLAPGLVWPKTGAHKELETVLTLSKKLSPNQSLPLWMGILNLTPDSFSDGGELNSDEEFEQRIKTFEANEIQIYDLGAESTRPRSKDIPSLTPETEWQRLQHRLQILKNRYEGRIFKPLLSVDTFHTSTAKLALENGADLINDVSGLTDLSLLEVLKTHSKCQYVLMHSLTIPADTRVTLQTDDVIETLLSWAQKKFEILNNAGIDLARVIFDPGIGFGKTPEQSLQILECIQEFEILPTRVLVGHSRKRFLNLNLEAHERDAETVGASLKLAQKGVDILRVHETALHARALQSFNGLS